MNNIRAHEVLKEMDPSQLTEQRLDSMQHCSSRDCELCYNYFSVWADRSKTSMRGDFTADQLEAIAAWMRDPKGVAEGVDNMATICKGPKEFNCDSISCKQCDYLKAL